KQIELGQRLTELLKQPQYQPLSVWQQTVSILAVTQGDFKAVPAVNIKPAQAALLAKLWADHKKEMQTLDKGEKPSDEVKQLVSKVAKAVAKGFEE
ncbi:MAG TPA: F0F1 ATP synthase subunit alpha, partial [Candidatus Saccharibacteria bacterium]|nr:F0F1 ATP synthase subunit alpha [Candidatus Saccharibacteria bacterium]